MLIFLRFYDIIKKAIKKGDDNMAKPLPPNINIFVEKVCTGKPYFMPAMEMATDHYNIGYIISGDRKCMTLSHSYSYHSGDVALMAPYIYHKTSSLSPVPYERIMIKFSPEYIKPFLTEFGKQFFTELYSQNVYHFTPESQKRIENLFYDIHEEFQKDGTHKEFILQGMLFRILKAVWDERIQDSSVTYHPMPLTAPIIDALTFIEKNYSQSPSIESAARIANFSTAYFSRLFHEQLGKSYSEYLDDIKLHHATILLIQTDLSIMEIAQQTGYCHGNYLSTKMKNKLGITPKAYRKNHRSKSNLT